MLAYFTKIHKTNRLNWVNFKILYICCFSTIFLEVVIGTSSNLKLAVDESGIRFNKSSYTHSQMFQKSFRGLIKFYLMFITLFKKTFRDSLKVAIGFFKVTKRLSFLISGTVSQCTVCVVNYVVNKNKL